jgi:TonB-dependent starch-binding outer membrane protein SusC
MKLFFILLAFLTGTIINMAAAQDSLRNNIKYTCGQRTMKDYPLLIVDGVPYDFIELQKMNPHDIASIDILKDIAATAMYGSNGINGVIIITTKAASERKLKAKNFLNNEKCLPSQFVLLP